MNFGCQTTTTWISDGVRFHQSLCDKNEYVLVDLLKKNEDCFGHDSDVYASPLYAWWRHQVLWKSTSLQVHWIIHHRTCILGLFILVTMLAPQRGTSDLLLFRRLQKLMLLGLCSVHSAARGTHENWMHQYWMVVLIVKHAMEKQP